MEENIIITPPPVSIIPEKYILTKEFESEEKLKIFFMAVLPTNPITLMVPTEGFQPRYIGILGYTHDAAVKKASEVYAKSGQSVISSYGDSETVEELLKHINYEGIVIQNVLPEPEKPKLMPIETFKASLLMASEEYLKDEADRIVLKKIISTIV